MGWLATQYFWENKTCSKPPTRLAEDGLIHMTRQLDIAISPKITQRLRWNAPPDEFADVRCEQLADFVEYKLPFQKVTYA